jgi:excisionase family DNA binding protein
MCHARNEHGVWVRMRHQSIDKLFGVEAALRELLRDVVREEFLYLRGELILWLEEQGRPAPVAESGADELLTVAQVARELQVVPGTIRGWIQSGALKSSRPGNGKQPGRTYRVRRADLDAFVAASEGRLGPQGARGSSPLCSVEKSNDGHREKHEVT